MAEALSGPSLQSSRFRDRREAGRLLVPLLHRFAERPDVIVLGLPRGGIPVAYEVALGLGVPLDVFTVRKLGVPEYRELAMGAVGSDGAYVLNREVIDALGISRNEIAHVAQVERHELERRERLYRGDRPFPVLEGKTVVLVDDGLATGASMLAGIHALRAKRPAKIVVAVPVASAESRALLANYVDEVVCYEVPASFGGVGEWYDDFSQVSDDEVRALLQRAAHRNAP